MSLEECAQTRIGVTNASFKCIAALLKCRRSQLERKKARQLRQPNESRKAVPTRVCRCAYNVTGGDHEAIQTEVVGTVGPTLGQLLTHVASKFLQLTSTARLHVHQAIEGSIQVGRGACKPRRVQQPCEHGIKSAIT